MTLRIIGREPSPYNVAREGPETDNIMDVLSRITRDIRFVSLEGGSTDDIRLNRTLIQNAISAQKNISLLGAYESWCDRLLSNLGQIRDACAGRDVALLRRLTGILTVLLGNDPSLAVLGNVAEYHAEAVKIASAVRDISVDTPEDAARSTLLVEDTIFEISQIRRSILYQISDNRAHVDSQLIMRENRSAYRVPHNIGTLTSIADQFRSQNGG